MLFILSPAKSLDYESPLSGQPHTPPLFIKQSKALIEVLRDFSPLQIAQLMDLSDTLSGLNVARYQAWSARATEKMRARRCWPLTAMCMTACRRAPWAPTPWPGRKTMCAS
jgi:cytoplasmic iron level regulating protein YaaA (DUF328/UPF0246 family)